MAERKDDPTGHDLTGTWHGTFSYPRQRPPLAFKLKMRQVGDTLEGVAEEDDDVRGAANAYRFVSDINGWIEGDKVEFAKTYRTARLRNYAVNYVGVFDASTSTVTGTWDIPGSWSGDFSMTKAPARPS